MKYEKNSRVIPTSDEVIKRKGFNIELYLKIQIESNRNDIDIHRHIRKDAINYTKWAKDLGVSRDKIRKDMKELIDLGFIKEYSSTDDIVYYKIRGKYDKYILFEEKFIRALLDLKVKNLIKIYLIYYKYTKKYGTCYLVQKDILDSIGYNDNGVNREMLRNINKILVSLELIKTDLITKHECGKTKTILNVTAPMYTSTLFYKNL
ncbi:hypothetical protein [Clostridium paraputrificum]|uniref:hypothetical protein n=1 Tax=Clostridium paraputrificum TaxID=29363 RepID=UPI0018A8F141|nr:hypothetical protein [Clostridium paraputrificum]MDB2099831.1 hypothetical protein [Clostridium paraputrificum]